MKKTTIKKTSVGEYVIRDIEVNTVYKISHLDKQEPKIEK